MSGQNHKEKRKQQIVTIHHSVLSAAFINTVALQTVRKVLSACCCMDLLARLTVSF